MINNDENNIKLRIGISTIGFKEKPRKESDDKNDPLLTKNIKFSIQSITLDDFALRIMNGYSFCQYFETGKEIFGNWGKTYENFRSAQFLWLDFDHSFENIYSAYNKLTYKPTIAYTTMSNSEEDFKFRFVYILDFTITEGSEYKRYLNIIINSVVQDLGKKYYDDKILDRSCFNPIQQMFGSKPNCILIKNFNNIFQKNDFDNISNSIVINQYVNMRTKISNVSKEGGGGTITENRNISTTASGMHRGYTVSYSNLDTAILDSNSVYTNVSAQNIYAIKYLYDTENHKYIKVPKGKRSNVLYYQAITLRNMEPNISFEKLRCNLLYFFRRHYEQGDFPKEKVIETAKCVMNLDLSNYSDFGKRKYVINPECIMLPKAEKMKELGIAKRKTRDEKILPNYDASISVKENADYLGYSTSTIYKCLNDNGALKRNDNKYKNFVKIYEENPESRSIRKLAKLSNLSKSTVQKYLKYLPISEVKIDIGNNLDVAYEASLAAPIECQNVNRDKPG